MGTGSTAEGCAVDETAAGAAGLTGTADTVGAGSVTPEGGTERLCAVRTSTPTAAPARARPPPAATSLPRCRRSLACRRSSSQGSTRASGAIAASGSGGSTGAAFVTAPGAAVSAPIRSRRARNSSIARIWSLSDSSTTTYNGASGPLGAGLPPDGRAEHHAVELPDGRGQPLPHQARSGEVTREAPVPGFAGTWCPWCGK